MMWIILFWIVHALSDAPQAMAQLSRNRLTPLAIDNHPCKPENLKNQIRYICDTFGNVTCNNGWSKANDSDPLHPCLTPICNPPCVHGKCKSPDLCACDIGWEGNDCNTCITLPGCVHGTCNGTALTCQCTEPTKWSGGLCNTPICNNCVNGVCIAPGLCKCNPGWSGQNCTACLPLQGCNEIGGGCVDPTTNIQVPNSCICKSDYTGPLCNRPKCNPPCVVGQGTCIFAFANNTNPICRCNLGWESASCHRCIPYPTCPKNATSGGCTRPFECNCDPGDTNPVCGIHLRPAF